ncbi:putative Sodium transport ATPase 5 [Glarea lozoyensis 74030]|uniref:P-type Na(+) transporter n=1 Tax=Glarea lozoyensis (strain ATCC 74030 / MF5533) TaxID=1104152 RepID=H0EHD3_GLAL7|nr:putative Sodium transport ATPase 5 [Glarea lozoyensis 74030]
MSPKKKSDESETHVSGQANKPLSLPPHALPSNKFIEELAVNVEDGLTSAEAKTRLEQYGDNSLDEGPGVQPAKILLKQVANAMMLVLLMAMAVSFGIGSYIEGGVVCAVIILNVVVGFFQEFNAEKTLDSLRSLSSPTASAIRDGKNETVATAHLVPGDIVELKTGDVVPADIRLLEVMNFETDEALLTGESLPVQKEANGVYEQDTGPGDRLNIAFSSSTVTKGRGRGAVFATGMKTEIGSIAAALRASGKKTREVKRKPDGSAKPHRYLEAWGKTAGDFVGMFLGVNVGTPLQPSLIVVLTITMAAGTKRMVQRNVVVRKLDSLEALGAVTDICSDKTGTLTQGKMVVKKAWIPARGTYSVGSSNDPFDPTSADLSHTATPPKDQNASAEKQETGDEKAQSADELLNDNNEMKDFLNIASLANLAHIHKADDGWKARGDPTEIAIQVFASRFDWGREKFTAGDSPQWEQVAEFPFDSDVKKMSVIFKSNTDDNVMVFTKGAVERILGSCVNVKKSSTAEPEDMTEEYEQEILANMEALAAQGLRVLALASRKWDGASGKNEQQDRNEVEQQLTFRGLVGLYDPPRPESEGAVRECHQAGISVHMLTGDHPGTARAIAAQVGILPPNSSSLSKPMADAMVMTASQFDKLSDDQIDDLPVLPLVIARCSPATKVRMIDALHRRNCFAAMTGDGVNDSPSLKRADVGIAMGQAGSDVAKDASDIVLTDDNFASILNAVEEGRRMFDNIQKFILHLLGQNIAQACTLLIGLAFKDESGLSVFPLSPVEIMWVIMVTSGAPDMGLGFERAVAGIMDRPPQSLKAGVFTMEVMVDMLVYGLLMAALCLASFSVVMFGFGDGNLSTGCNDSFEGCETVFRARATTFVCMTWFSLFLAWQMIDMRRSFFRMKPDSPYIYTQWARDIWANKFLFWAVIFGFVTIFPIVYIPGLNRVVFKHTGISWEWGVVVVCGIIFIGGCEAWKWGKRVFFRRRAVTGLKGDLSTSIFAKYNAEECATP